MFTTKSKVNNDYVVDELYDIVKESICEQLCINNINFNYVVNQLILRLKKWQNVENGGRKHEKKS